MRHPSDSRPPARLIDDEAKGIFIFELRRGLSVESAARAAGFTGGGMWRARQADGAFNEAVEDALEWSNAPRWVSPGNGRPLQVRRIRRLRFVEWRREVFLNHFAATGDETAAAEAAGVNPSTVWRHRQKDADFLERWRQALAQCIATLEAELVRQRMAARARAKDEIVPQSEPPAEFDLILKLLQRWDRKDGGAGARQVGYGHLQRWDFDAAIDEMERKLKAIGIPVRDVPRDKDGDGESAQAAE